jgi:hypothetical protein
MTISDSKKRRVATAVRVEYDQNNDDTFIVFKIIDEAFKQKIRDNWDDGIELKMINTCLVVEKE